MKSVTRAVASRMRRRYVRMVGERRCTNAIISSSGAHTSSVIRGSTRAIRVMAIREYATKPAPSTQTSVYPATSSTSSRKRLTASAGVSGRRRLRRAVSR